jgi:hypothetical protein
LVIGLRAEPSMAAHASRMMLILDNRLSRKTAPFN